MNSICFADTSSSIDSFLSTDRGSQSALCNEEARNHLDALLFKK